MKKVMLSLALVMGLGLTYINAQDAKKVSFGVKGEANMSNFNISDMPGVKSDFGVGATIGGFAKIDFNQHFALQPELLFHWQNSTLKFNGQKNDFPYWEWYKYNSSVYLKMYTNRTIKHLFKRLSFKDKICILPKINWFYVLQHILFHLGFKK